MGCANCTHNITSNGLVVINDQSISDDLKAFSLEKGQFPSSKTNSTSDESNQINLPVNSSHLPLSFPDIEAIKRMDGSGKFMLGSNWKKEEILQKIGY